MTLVYRVQSKLDRTRGAYRSHWLEQPESDVVRELCDTHLEDDEHPSPRCDAGIGRYPEENEHCGFKSAADLLRWFKGWIPRLLRTEYEIIALDNVIVTAVGKYQVLFTWKRLEGYKMILENQNMGSEYGIESRTLNLHDWQLVGIPGEGYETYEETHQKTLEMAREISEINLDDVELRVVVYDYDGSVRKNIRILTVITTKDFQKDFQNHFDDTTNWCVKHPGSRVFTCPFCGIYEASETRCNECEEEIE